MWGCVTNSSVVNNDSTFGVKNATLKVKDSLLILKGVQALYELWGCENKVCSVFFIRDHKRHTKRGQILFVFAI